LFFEHKGERNSEEGPPNRARHIHSNNCLLQLHQEIQMGHHKKHKHRHRDRKKDKKTDDDRHRERRRRSPSSSSLSSDSRLDSDEVEYREEKRFQSGSLSNKGKTMEQIEDERQLMQREKKKARDMGESFEAPQEKRQRRLAKKTEKERRQKSALGWDTEYMGMTNANNPFGNERLLETFVWDKKLKQIGLADMSTEKLKMITAQHVEENKTELEKLKRQRLERERQREEMEKENELLHRVKEAEYYREWKKQEDSFHYNQVRLLSKIRIMDGRAKPIDLLARYINEDDDNLAVEMQEPSSYLNGLTIRDLQDLVADIRVYTDLEAQQKMGSSGHRYDAQYWKDITVITEDELAKKLSSQLYNDQRIDDRREGINAAVHTDVTETFKNKTHQQLEQLEQCIRLKIENETDIDIG
jgi:hypothetical protein